MDKNDTKLFVDEDEDMDESHAVESGNELSGEKSAIKVKPEPKDEILDMEVEGDSDTDVATPQSDDDDDAIVESIPLFINSLPQRDDQSTHLLQFLNKPRTMPHKLHHLGAAVKRESNYLQVKVPLDTSKFYDESKIEEWGVPVTEHEHIGVLNKTHGGLYAAKFVINDGKKQVHLIPVDSTTQLRPSFKYLDDIETLRILQRKESIDQSGHKTAQNVHVLQSTAKSSKSSSNDPFANTALGDSLRHVKRFEQEPWSPLTWTNDRHDLNTIMETTTELETSTTMDDYLFQLTH